MDMLLGTERINVVYNCSRGTLKMRAELFSEEETKFLSKKKKVV